MNDWRTHLHTLREVEAPEALWQRIAQARAESAPSPRRAARWMPAAGLAAAVSLAALLAQLRDGPVPPTGAAVAPALTALPPALDSTALRALDDAIALAYARNATQDELDSLWQTRERLLGSPAESEPLLARL